MEDIVLVDEVLETVAPAAADPTMIEKLVESLGVAALGMITVFAGLVILIVFITLLSKFTAKGEGKKKNDRSSGEVKKADDASGDAEAANAAAAVNSDSVPADVVAAISAALAMMLGEGKFVVRHVKRIHNAPAWNRAGREEQIYSRF